MLRQGSQRGVAARVGGWSARHKKAVLAGWLAFVVLSVVLGGAVGTSKLTQADQYTGQSGQAEQTLEQHFPRPAQEEALISSSTLRAGDPAFQAAIRDVRARVARVGVVGNVHAATDRGHADLISKDGRSALVQFDIKGRSDSAGDRVAPVQAAVRAAQKAHPELRIEEFGDASVGAAINRSIDNDLKRAETLSLPVTLLILVIAFGALVAAGVPVLLAISAVIATVGLVAIPSHVFPIDDNTSIVITLIGMAVGVDYSLFYLKREREERLAGRDATAAVQIASATSGRAIVASGLTVMVAMAGQFLTGDKSSASFAVGTIMVVAVAMLGSLTALPAFLALLGRHVDKGRIRIPFRRRSSRTESRVWGFVLDRALARPGIAAAGSVLVLLAIASPALHLKIHTTGPNDLPANFPGITTYHHLERAFPDSQMPAVVVVQARDTTVPAVRSAIARMDARAVAAGVARQPIVIDTNAARTVTTVAMPIAGGGGTGSASNAALARLRGMLIPSTLGQLPGVTANVTGDTAIDHDQTAMLSRNAPLVFGFVLGLAFLLLLLTFRSIVIPIKAIVLNLLSVAAAYGVLVAVFQDGHGASLLGFTPTGGVAPWLPLFLFVILFGLSMDYHVFILSRVKELVDRGVPTAEAVSQGIRSTAGVVTSAAVVMVGVFSIFVSLTLIDFKEFGIGLAAAILIDATVIRGVLLPATMKMLGDWNWYLPRPLRWLPQPASGVDRPLEAAGD
jgi:uncharacterized membrane protein YdfJ with MMPL/SSD domain